MKRVRQAEGFSGVVLIARDGKVLFARPYGMANLELDVPNTLDSKFRLASITKQFTAAAILLLQQRRKISVSDTLCTYLRDCPATWKAITIHQLLCHTSGIYSFTESDDNDRYDPLSMPVLDTVARFKDKPLDFALVVLRNQQEDFPGDLKNLKIVHIGKGLSAIAFGLAAPTLTTH